MTAVVEIKIYTDGFLMAEVQDAIGTISFNHLTEDQIDDESGSGDGGSYPRSLRGCVLSKSMSSSDRTGGCARGSTVTSSLIDRR